MSLSVPIATAVKKVSKNITFLQPIFEAISNSLEAGAQHITVEFEAENALPGITPKVIGFTIIDDGDGFTPKNRNAFCELWTSNKIDMGCKGFGRLTWLYVFNTVLVKSFTSEEEVDIEFNLNFDKEQIKCKKSLRPKKTIMKFSGVTENIYKQSTKKNGTKDLRPEADLLVLKDAIEKHLLAKLSLIKEQGRTFSIRLKLFADEMLIDNNNIQQLSQKEFVIKGTDEQDYDFHLFYAFIEDGNKARDLFYCANYRTVNDFDSDINLKKLQTTDSIIMLLCSDYLDMRVNDERTAFVIPDSTKNDIPIEPISFSEINDILKNTVQSIIVNRYPDLVQNNDSEIEAAIEEAPYLAKYIKTDDSIIKSKDALIKSARTKYEKDKLAIKNRFAGLLEKKEIEPTGFLSAIEDVADMATRELGQYIVYRQQIIDGLKRISDNDERVEALLHNLFFTIGEQDVKGVRCHSNRYDNNIWLLDDKFMSYSSMFSDKKIQAILDELHNDNIQEFGANKEPDITAFYSKSDGFKDLVLIEFKAIGATTDQKMSAIAEINRNIKFILQRMEDVNCVYGYVITKITDELKEYFESDPNIHKLFACGSRPMYYYPNGVLKDANNVIRFAHIYILDAETIYEDSNARNKTFLDILKQE